MADRDAILDYNFHEAGMEDAIREITTKPYEAVVNSLDQYMKESVIEAFEFIAKHTTGHSINEQGNIEFKYKGEWISKETLFENFL